jgi:hypothetical protein
MAGSEYQDHDGFTSDCRCVPRAAFDHGSPAAHFKIATLTEDLKVTLHFSEKGVTQELSVPGILLTRLTALKQARFGA